LAEAPVAGQAEHQMEGLSSQERMDGKGRAPSFVLSSANLRLRFPWSNSAGIGLCA